MSKHDDPDFDFEPIAGLPSELPEDETILWSGTPEKWQLGLRIFPTRAVAVVAVVLAVSSIFSGMSHGASAGQMTLTFVSMLFVGAAIIGFAMVWGWLVAINTVYTVTNKRLVIRHGVTLPMAINVPFAKVANAAAKIRDDGTGDVSVAMLDGNRVSIVALWPHNRPWSWQGPTPAMRCIPDASRVAQILHDALVRYATQAGETYQGERPKLRLRTRDHEASDVRGAEPAVARSNAEAASA